MQRGLTPSWRTLLLDVQVKCGKITARIRADRNADGFQPQQVKSWLVYRKLQLAIGSGLGVEVQRLSALDDHALVQFGNDFLICLVLLDHEAMQEQVLEWRLALVMTDGPTNRD